MTQLYPDRSITYLRMSSESEDELSHFKPSGLLYTTPQAAESTKTETDIHASKPKTNLLKYYECEDFCDPRRFPSSTFKVFVFKETTVIDTIDLSTRSYYRLGRDESINHIPLLHQSISSQHAVLQYRYRDGRCRLYLMDLDSANGTKINNGEIEVEGKRFYEILDGDVIKFGASTREYVFMKNK